MKTTKLPTIALAALARIRLVSIDVDGVLTDGRKYYGRNGLAHLSFSARDGLGVHLLRCSDYHVVLISNGRSPILKARAADLGIRYVFEGVTDKGAVLRQLRRRLRIGVAATLHAGDDLWDIPAFAEAAVRVAVPEAPQQVRKAANWITTHPGGHGAVREVADTLLLARQIDPLRLLLQTRT